MIELLMFSLLLENQINKIIQKQFNPFNSHKGQFKRRITGAVTPKFMTSTLMCDEP